MKPIKLVYFGTPDFSATILSSLIKDKNIDVVGIVPQPDKPVGLLQNLIVQHVVERIRRAGCRIIHESPILI